MDHPLAKYRLDKGLTQKQLAERLRVSRQLVSLIETGDRSVTPENAKEWEGIIGIPRATLCPDIFA